jgi:archaemetzincin
MPTVLPTAHQRSLAHEPDTIEDEVKKIIYTPDPDFFSPIGRPNFGEWLNVYDETAQPVWEYQDYNRIQGEKRNVIYLYILDIDHQEFRLNILADYLRAFYYPIKVRFMDSEPNEVDTYTTRFHQGFKQIKAGGILKKMKKKLPSDAYCMVAITLTDLYPSDDYNFIFGCAQLTGRVGVFSFARYEPNYYDKKSMTTQQAKDVILKRACHTCAHELGHNFGMQHCVYYRCMYQGSNSLLESDAQPGRLCPVCLRKLQLCIGFDEMERYRKLLQVYEQYPSIFKEEGEWLKKRIQWIEQKVAEQN